MSVTIRYQTWGRDGRPKTSEKEFKTEAAMQKWAAKAEEKDNWGGILAYLSEPRTIADVNRDQGREMEEALGPIRE